MRKYSFLLIIFLTVILLINFSYAETQREFEVGAFMPIIEGTTLAFPYLGINANFQVFGPLYLQGAFDLGFIFILPIFAGKLGILLQNPYAEGEMPYFGVGIRYFAISAEKIYFSPAIIEGALGMNFNLGRTRAFFEINYLTTLEGFSFENIFSGENLWSIRVGVKI